MSKHIFCAKDNGCRNNILNGTRPLPLLGFIIICWQKVTEQYLKLLRLILIKLIYLNKITFLFFRYSKIIQPF